MKRIIFIGILGVGILFGCNSEGTPGAWKEHNLLRYDLPVRVMGPDSVKVTSNNLLFSKDVTIEGALEDGYGIQIFSSEASSQDPKKIKAEELAASKKHQFFDELIQDDDQGFIFSTKLDSANVYHGFKYIKVQGAKEYIYQNLSGRKYDLDDVKKMYKAVQPKKK